MEDKLITIQLTDTTELRLRTRMFNQLDGDDENEVDMDRLLMIDMAHIEAELVTFPVLLNMLGIALAEATNKHSEAKINLEVFAAKRKEEIRAEHLTTPEEDDDEEDSPKAKKAKPKKALTLDEVDARLSADPKYVVKRLALAKRQKEVDLLNSLYWSAKSKDDKLNKLSLTIQAGDVYDNLASSKLRRFNMVDISGIRPTKKDS